MASRDGTFPFTSFPRVSGLWRRVYGKGISVVHSAAWGNGVFASPELSYSNPTWVQVRSHDAQNQKPFTVRQTVQCSYAVALPVTMYFEVTTIQIAAIGKPFLR